MPHPMMMPEQTGYAAGKKVKAVHCDKCGQDYFYHMTRKAETVAKVTLLRGRSGAQDAADQLAQHRVKEMLEEDVDLVPCPNCNWVSAAMVKQFARQKYGWLRELGLLPVVAGIIAGVIINFNSSGGDSDASVLPITLIILGFILTAGILILQWYLKKNYNPNANHPALPVLPKDTPQPMILRVVPGSGRQQFVPVAYRNPGMQR